MTFASTFKAILRQDPDIISISEIRDQETASLAVRAAMTGRMVLTTLHTNDIFGIFDRLLDLGVSKNMLAHHLCGVATQKIGSFGVISVWGKVVWNVLILATKAERQCVRCW